MCKEDILTMITKEDLAKVQLKIAVLKGKGFYDNFINEILGIAMQRYIATGDSYVECLEFVIYDEISRCEFAVIGENDIVKPIENDVN